MKELSIEEKARRYDEAKLRISAAYNNNRCTIGFMNEIFPELKESKGEKTKRILHSISSKISFHLRDIFTEEEFQCFDAWSHAWLEKQGEQNPADKVEPKFHEGDWITDGNITIQIEAIKNNCYLYCGDCALYSTKTADKVYHLWTIQDAKDGDVLSYRDGQWCFIYKGIVTEDTFKYYALLSEKGITVNDAAFSLLISCIIPATKEQRDLLFQKMKEAGYEWNTEKKELKRIECIIPPKFKVGDKVYSLRNRFECTIESIDETVYYGDTTNFDIKDQDNWKLVDPAWSEEDDEMLDSIIEEVRYIGDFPDYPTKEENELYDECLAKVEWLKSLKERYTWKPSDEQMRALEHAINCYSCISPTNTEEVYTLEIMKEQLKKLREE